MLNFRWIFWVSRKLYNEGKHGTFRHFRTKEATNLFNPLNSEIISIERNYWTIVNGINCFFEARETYSNNRYLPSLKREILWFQKKRNKIQIFCHKPPNAKHCYTISYAKQSCKYKNKLEKLQDSNEVKLQLPRSNMHHSISIIIIITFSWRWRCSCHKIWTKGTRDITTTTREGVAGVSSNLWGTIGREKERVQPVCSFTFAPLGHTVFSLLVTIDTRNSFPLRHRIIDFLSDTMKSVWYIRVCAYKPHPTKKQRESRKQREDEERERERDCGSRQGCGSIIEITKRE